MMLLFLTHLQQEFLLKVCGVQILPHSWIVKQNCKSNLKRKKSDLLNGTVAQILSSEPRALPADRDVRTVLSHFCLSPPLHTQLSSPTSGWLLPISPLITALFLL